MTCTVSPESYAMLSSLLLAEKEDTRVLLRTEMDRLVDSMFHRLTNKLMMNSHFDRYQSGDGSQMGNHDDQLCPPPNQLHQSSFVIAQPSTSSHLITPHQNVHYSYQQQPNDNPIHSNDNSNQQSQLMISLIQPTMSPNSNFGAPIFNEPTTTDQVHCLPSSTSAVPNSSQPAIANEQFNTNFDDDEDAGECYCDECLGAIEIDDEVEDDDDSDSVQCIEDEQEDGESSRPVKRPKLDLTQPNNALPEVTSQSPRQATSEAQPNQVTKQFITVHLQCPLSECPDTFTKDQLNQHMFDKHDIGPNRCLVKDCKQSFNNNFILKKHLKQSHPHTTQWHCDKCLKHFAQYQLLSKHNYDYHQLGHFQCSFLACTFTGEYKQKVFNHYITQHKPEFVCSQSDCNYRTYNVTRFKAHECAHLGIKPYRCEWPDCDIFSSYQHNVLSHIRTKHLARFESPNQNVAHSANPKDYLEVASELLF